jgi:hypothetical protein
VIAASFAVAGVAIAALVVLLAAATVGWRYWRTRQERRRAELVEPLRQLLVRLVTDPTPGEPSYEHEQLLRLAEPTWAALEPTILDMLRKVRGESRERLVRLVVARGTAGRVSRRAHGLGAVRRAHAAELLGLLRQPDSRDDLVRLLADRDPEVRLVAARALGELGDPSGAAPLLHSLVGDRPVPMRVVARSLARLGADTGPVLVDGLDSPSAVVRSVCAEIAGLLGVTAAQDALLSVLVSDVDEDVRVRAARALGRIGLPTALPALVDATGALQAPSLRAVAARALGDLGGPGPVEFLERLLSDHDHRVSSNAAQSMWRSGPAGVVRLRRLAGAQGAVGDCAREAMAMYAVSPGLVMEPSSTVPVPAPRVAPTDAAASTTVSGRP